MDIHQNARLTLRSREALVEIVRGGLGLSRAAASFHVTPKTSIRRFPDIRTRGNPLLPTVIITLHTRVHLRSGRLRPLSTQAPGYMRSGAPCAPTDLCVTRNGTLR